MNCCYLFSAGLVNNAGQGLSYVSVGVGVCTLECGVGSRLEGECSVSCRRCYGNVMLSLKYLMNTTEEEIMWITKVAYEEITRQDSRVVCEVITVSSYSK